MICVLPRIYTWKQMMSSSWPLTVSILITQIVVLFLHCVVIIFYFATYKRLVRRPCRYPVPHENIPLDVASTAETRLTQTSLCWSQMPILPF